ncbi:hypothetical protein HBI56_014580 [Parastagonospora nodorum]|nr:hypothetical protein HBH53_008150 [Parastagonospora nodorum]KAH4007738.1 hypothetical protein HBI10_001240 [Parastagonospora nodorum]KAH4016512.1 hypothetical protein HBI13_149250 [Parastagonospora nodorum]KAH4040752.1 hypothetical protein HBI09_013430 [Parastagonospora nodorum]KAH4058692.1 hypothetical protein HBH49_036450 [Parastagonospora nodorum]
MIRAYELREEDAVKNAIQRIIVPLEYVNKNAPDVAMEYIDFFPDLPSIVRGDVYILSSLLEKLEAPTNPNFDEVFDLVAGSVWSCPGVLMILDVKKPLPSYMHKAHEIELGLNMAKRSWTMYCGVEVNFG